MESLIPVGHIMKMLTLLMASIDWFIANGLLGDGAELDEASNWDYGFTKYIYHIPGLSTSVSGSLLPLLSPYLLSSYHEVSSLLLPPLPAT